MGNTSTVKLAAPDQSLIATGVNGTIESTLNVTAGGEGGMVVWQVEEKETTFSKKVRVGFESSFESCFRIYWMRGTPAFSSPVRVQGCHVGMPVQYGFEFGFVLSLSSVLLRNVFLFQFRIQLES